MQADVTKTTVAHLCIDPQTHLLKDFAPKRKAATLSRWRTFADDIFKKPATPIPTIWVAFCSEFKAYAAAQTRPTRDLRNMLSLAIYIKEHEDVFEKAAKNAFEENVLFPYLKEKYPEIQTVAITGLFTTACVKRSIQGALDSGLNCIGLYDLMAELEPKPLSFHRDYLTKQFPEAMANNRLRLINQNSFFQEIAQRPAVPASGFLLMPQS